jgi:hypothetical protein
LNVTGILTLFTIQRKIEMVNKALPNRRGRPLGKSRSITATLTAVNLPGHGRPMGKVGFRQLTLMTHNSETKSLFDWGAQYDLKMRVICSRFLDLGWSPAETLGLIERRSCGKDGSIRKCHAHLSYNGETRTLIEWQEVTGIRWKKLSARFFKLSWTEAETLGIVPRTSVRRPNRKGEYHENCI